ncbi:MAG: hypothetical protein V1836_04000 [Candidatus Aenigmatarchaeota archaeon]
MLTFGPREALKIRHILDDAKALMELETMAQRLGNRHCDAVAFHGFVNSTAARLKDGGRFRNLGAIAYDRINSVSEFEETGAELLAKIFPQEILRDMPFNDESQKIETQRRPYSLQFSMSGEQFYYTCAALDFKKGFASSNGLCLSPYDIKPEVRRALSGSIFFARTDYFPVYQGEWFREGEPRKPAAIQISASAVTERHEEIHTWQTLMRNAGYLHFNNTLEQDLLDEESAECIAEVENDSRRPRKFLLHTSLYVEYDIDKENFVELTRYVHPDNPQRVIGQRKMNANALGQVYGKNDPRLNRLVGWALHLMDFYRANRTLRIIPAVYETL